MMTKNILCLRYMIVTIFLTDIYIFDIANTLWTCDIWKKTLLYKKYSIIGCVHDIHVIKLSFFVTCLTVETWNRVKKVKVKVLYSCSWITPWHSYGVSPAIWDHPVLPSTQHKWTHTCLNPSHTDRYSIYLPRRDGRLSWPRWLVNRDGLPTRRQSPIQVLTGSSVD